MKTIYGHRERVEAQRELRDTIAKAIADSIGHGMREKCYPQADAVLAVIAPNDSRALSEVIGLMRKREAYGIATYGDTVDRSDVTPLEWLSHLREELMGGALYATRAMHRQHETIDNALECMELNGLHGESAYKALKAMITPQAAT